jgi:hypothetical protein
VSNCEPVDEKNFLMNYTLYTKEHAKVFGKVKERESSLLNNKVMLTYPNGS